MRRRQDDDDDDDDDDNAARGDGLEGRREKSEEGVPDHPRSIHHVRSSLSKEIWEPDFVTFRLPVFMCQWVESNHVVREDELGFTLVDRNWIGHKNDLYIMATQAKQIFYVNDPLDARW